jgi:site-specific DNA recombinase
MPPVRVSRSRVAIYIRMSKDRQEDSPERQRGQVLPHIERQGYDITEEYFDPGISGDEFWKREAFQRLLRDAKAGKFDGIVVDHKDRISRQIHIDYVHDIVHPLYHAGVWVETVASGRLDWDSMVGQLTDQINQHQASEEPAKIAYRTLTQLMEKAGAGQGAGGPVPYGYVMTYLEQMVKGRLKQIPQKYALGDPEKVKVVRWLFLEYATGRRSIEQLRDELHARGVPGPRGTEWWGKSTITRILANRRYLGDWVYNRKHCGKHATATGGKVETATGRHRRKPGANPEADWVVKPDWHPAIIDRETFAQVQARLAENRENKTPIKGGGNFALNGLLVCGKCHLPMHGFNERGECKYRCSGEQRFGSKFCNTNTTREPVVLKSVVNALQAELLNPAFFEEALAEARRLAEEARESGTAEGMRTRLEALDKQIDQGNHNLTVLPPDRLGGVVAKLRELEDERQQLAADLERVENVAEVSDLEAVVAEAKRLLWDLRAAFDEGDPARVRFVLQEFVDRIVLEFRPKPRPRNRSPLRGGTIYLKDATSSQTVGSLPVRSHMHHGLAALRKYLEPRLQ